MIERITSGTLLIHPALHDLVAREILPGTGVTADAFWSGLERIVAELGPRTRALLAHRDTLQARLDAWHIAHRGATVDGAAYRAFLAEVGYLVPEGPAFQVETVGVDSEIATLAGPQLVVPVMNARFALNAANARWGSLYDALYGSDVIGEDGGRTRGGPFNPARGAAVIAYAAAFLDRAVPLSVGGHAEVAVYAVVDGALQVALTGGGRSGLSDPSQFVGYRGQPDQPEVILLQQNGLHIELQVDRSHPIGRGVPSGVRDVVVEAALTTIQDLEDSISAVDAEDKVAAYRNWLGLMQGTLTETFEKDGHPRPGRWPRTVNTAIPTGRYWCCPVDPCCWCALSAI